MSQIDRALKRLNQEEQAAVRKFWAEQKRIARQDQEFKKQNVFFRGR